MNISAEEKRQIMAELAQGSPELGIQMPTVALLPDELAFDDNNYQTFDEFAQRPYQDGTASIWTFLSK